MFDPRVASSYLIKKENVGNSVDYNSFLTRDYKSMAAPASPAKRRWTRLHTVVVLASITAIGTLLSLASQDAVANRPQQITIEENTPLSEPVLAVPRQQITIPLAIPEITAEAEPKQQTTEALNWVNFKVKNGDSLAYLFKRNNLSAAELHQIMKLGKLTRSLRYIKPGQHFRVSMNQQQQINELFYDINKLESLHIKRTDSAFTAKLLKRPVDKRTTFASAVIDSSLFEAGKNAGMGDALIMQLVGVFGWDIDFALDIRKGDRFNILYEEQFLEGKKLKDGPIIAAEFTNQGRTYKAVRYTDAKGRTDYYSDDGRSMRKAFLRTPVDFRRISSRFGKRHHPTLNRMKLHKGVDYAARTGTPIKAAGDGKVIFRGRKGGYGKVIILQHGGRYSTLYAHMSRYKKGVYAGKRVKQGQIIGYVGSTGRATGPHLHYEFRVNGAHRNPLTVRLPDAAPIAKKYKADFAAASQSLLAQLDARKPTQVASNN
jgi:murein DD-endopeptidase MepM/ murein hydrolase activator NlpD